MARLSFQHTLEGLQIAIKCLLSHLCIVSKDLAASGDVREYLFPCEPSSKVPILRWLT